MALLIHEKTKEVYNCPDSFLSQLGGNLPVSRGLISCYLTDKGYNRLQRELAGNDFGARMNSENWSGYRLYEVRKQEQSFDRVSPGRVALNVELDFLEDEELRGTGGLVSRIEPFVLGKPKTKETDDSLFDYCRDKEDKNSF